MRLRAVGEAFEVLLRDLFCGLSLAELGEGIDERDPPVETVGCARDEKPRGPRHGTPVTAPPFDADQRGSGCDPGPVALLREPVAAASALDVPALL
jgi:hypothetical protein